MSTIPADTLVVVADGRGARVFRNAAESRKLELRQDAVLEGENMNDDGPSGSQPSESDTDEATFAKQLAHQLNQGALKHKYKHLVLVADPGTLGQMRPLLHKETQARLLQEIPKTLTGMPIEGIEKALS